MRGGWSASDRMLADQVAAADRLVSGFVGTAGRRLTRRHPRQRGFGGLPVARRLRHASASAGLLMPFLAIAICVAASAGDRACRHGADRSGRGLAGTRRDRGDGRFRRNFSLVWARDLDLLTAAMQRIEADDTSPDPGDHSRPDVDGAAGPGDRPAVPPSRGASGTDRTGAADRHADPGTIAGRARRVAPGSHRHSAQRRRQTRFLARICRRCCVTPTCGRRSTRPSGTARRRPPTYDRRPDRARTARDGGAGNPPPRTAGAPWSCCPIARANTARALARRFRRQRQP